MIKEEIQKEGYDVGKQVWMQKFQDAAGNPQPPPQDFWDTATYAYNQGKDPVEAGEEYAAFVSDHSPRYETDAEADLAKFQQDRFSGR